MKKSTLKAVAQCLSESGEPKLAEVVRAAGMTTLLVTAKLKFWDDLGLSQAINKLSSDIRANAPVKGKWWNKDKSLVLEVSTKGKAEKMPYTMTEKAKGVILSVAARKNIRYTELIVKRTWIKLVNISTPHRLNRAKNKQTILDFVADLEKEVPNVSRVETFWHKRPDTFRDISEEAERKVKSLTTCDIKVLLEWHGVEE